MIQLTPLTIECELFKLNISSFSLLFIPRKIIFAGNFYVKEKCSNQDVHK